MQQDFNPALGFVNRSDVQKSSLEGDYKPRPDLRWIRQLEFGADITYLSNFDEVLQTRDQELSVGVEMESGDFFEFEYTRNMEKQEEPFRLAGRLQVPVGIYRNNIFALQIRPYRGRAVSGFFMASREDFWGGKKTSLNLNPSLRWSDKLATDFAYELERVVLPQGAFTSHIINSRFDVNLSNRWLSSTTAQYNQVDDE